MKSFAPVAAFLAFSGSLFADLPPESVDLNEKYSEDRARGLVGLNQRYIEAFQKQMKAATQSGDIEGAIAIRDRIGELEAENARLSGNPEEPEMVTEKEETEEKLDLKGKTVWFAHDTSPDREVGFKFLGDGKAVWIGLGGIEVDRAYKALDQPRTFHVWWPERSNDVGYEIAVSEDGRSAVVKNLARNLLTDGEVKRSR